MDGQQFSPVKSLRLDLEHHHAFRLGPLDRAGFPALRQIPLDRRRDADDSGMLPIGVIPGRMLKMQPDVDWFPRLDARGCGDEFDAQRIVRGEAE